MMHDMFSRVSIYGMHHISVERDSCQVLELEDAHCPNIIQSLPRLLRKNKIGMAKYTAIKSYLWFGGGFVYMP